MSGMIDALRSGEINDRIRSWMLEAAAACGNHATTNLGVRDITVCDGCGCPFPTELHRVWELDFCASRDDVWVAELKATKDFGNKEFMTAMLASTLNALGAPPDYIEQDWSEEEKYRMNSAIATSPSDVRAAAVYALIAERDKGREEEWPEELGV